MHVLSSLIIIIATDSSVKLKYVPNPTTQTLLCMAMEKYYSSFVNTWGKSPSGQVRNYTEKNERKKTVLDLNIHRRSGGTKVN